MVVVLSGTNRRPNKAKLSLSCIIGSYLSRGELGGKSIPHPPNSVHSTLSILHSSFSLQPAFMAYHNNQEDPSFYPTSTTEFGPYPSLQEPPAVDLFHGQGHDILRERWGMAPWEGPLPSLPTSLPQEANFGSVAGATSVTTGLSDYDLPPWIYCDQWPTVPQRPEVNFLDADASFTESAGGSGAFAAIPTPSSVPFHHWEENQNEPSTSTFDWNVNTSSQSGFGPARTGRVSSGRFQPYRTSRAHENEHGNTEVHQPTAVPPHVLHFGFPKTQPTGGTIPEATADADKTQPLTEEKEVPAPKRTRLANGQGKPREARKREQADSRELRSLIQRWKGLQTKPSLERALSFAVEYIPTVRAAVYQLPRLATGATEPLPESSKRARNERIRRDAERRRYEELSRYYQLDSNSGEEVWKRPPLLMEVLQDLKVRHPPPGLANAPIP
ncbi:hypothetical protein BJ322DRAFT_497312 [Thelephora terrestris]|uniref:Uncharacterized protein n=1 Tax=Thelephora terrestris TaxID=56493 RepID=A0A9P6H4M9_9AGAM|nr:hypothetical protein BJ322DRAFT_497312 [Thelephora terrestris]